MATLEGQISLLFKWGPSALRRQIGYKLGALLMYRLERPGGMNEILFGDDSESDPFVTPCIAMWSLETGPRRSRGRLAEKESLLR